MPQTIQFRDLYPGEDGYSSLDYGTGEVDGAETSEAQAVEHPAATIGGQANPVLGMVGAVGALLLLMWIGRKLGKAEDFRSVRVTGYNALVITLCVVAVMPVLKFAAAKWPVKGVSPWVLAA